MAISFVGATENSADGGADVTLNLTAITGLAENDLVLVGYAIGDDDTVDMNMAIVSPTGYTEIADIFATSAGTDKDCNLGVYGKFMPATPDTSVVVDGLGGADASVVAVAMAFRGCDTTTLDEMDLNNTVATGQDSFNPDPPSISGLGATNWSVIVGGSAHGIQADSTYTFPTGYTTNAVDRGQSAAETNYATVGMGYKTNPGNPEDPGVMTHSGTNNAAYSWAAVTVPLYESSATPATATPGVVNATSAVPAATLTTGTAATPSAVNATAAVPAATLTTGTTTIPSVVNATAAVPAVTVLTGGDATVSVGVVNATAAVPAATILTESNATVLASVVNAVANVGAVTIQTGSTVLAGVVNAVANALTVVVDTGGAAAGAIVNFIDGLFFSK